MEQGRNARRTSMGGACAVVLLVLAGASRADEPITLFARVFGAAEVVEVDAPEGTAGVARRTRVSNYRTIFGVRGTESLGGGYQAVWQLSGGFPIDNLSAGNFISTRGL